MRVYRTRRQLLRASCQNGFERRERPEDLPLTGSRMNSE